MAGDRVRMLGMRAWGPFVLGAVLLTGGCAHVLTAPPGPSCAPFMTAYTPQPFATAPDQVGQRTSLDAVLDKKVARRAAAMAAPSDAALAPAPLTLDVLVLSGGGSYGAYGAGFLTGLYGAGGGPPAAAATALRDYDFISGVSTGAIMTTFVWGAVVEARAGVDPSANRGLKDLSTLYDVSDKDLFRAQSALPALLFSNGLYDPKGLLESRVRDAVAAYAPLLRSDTSSDKAEVGAVNLTNGRFYSFDLKGLVNAPGPEGLACYSEGILASSAIPLAFPPRFIDGYPYYDGGVRFLAYFDDMIRALRKRADRRDIMLNITLIVNGSQSANEAGDDAAAALACDSASLADTAKVCPPISNSLIGSLSGGDKGLIPRTVEDIMVQQLKVDAVSRIYEDWRTSGYQGNFRYTYIPNSELTSPPPGAGLSGACQAPRNSTAQFDPAFMKCLFAIGRYNGASGAWVRQEFQSREKAEANAAVR
jgi:hypothetical protein